jgi:hypothetical protein
MLTILDFSSIYYIDAGINLVIDKGDVVSQAFHQERGSVLRAYLRSTTLEWWVVGKVDSLRYQDRFLKFDPSLPYSGLHNNQETAWQEPLQPVG